MELLTTFQMDKFDPHVVRGWMMENWGTSSVASVIYLVFLLVTHRYMRNRKAMSLDKPLVLWNFMLAIFSMLGTFYTYEDIFTTLRQSGFTSSFCLPGDYYKGCVILC